MKRLLLPLLLLLLTALPLVAQTPATTLSGTVRDAAGQPLPGANVFLKSTFDGASTDSVGRFRFTTRQTGTLSLVVTLLSYQLQEQPVVLDGTAKHFAITLKAARNELGLVVITAGAFEASDEKRATVLTSRDVVTTAGALADVAGALNTLPGISRNGEEGKLFVRGGAAGETKQYLDGLPLQSPYNASVSGVPARGRFTPDLFKGTVFSTGGYSAEYGQALSAAVILNSVDLEPETQTGISLLSLGQVSLSQRQRWERSSVAVTGNYMNMKPYFGLVPQRLLTASESGGGSVAFRQRTGDVGMLKVYGAFTGQHSGVRTPDVEWQNGRPIDLRNTNGYLNASFRSPLRRGWSVQTGVAATRDEQKLHLGVRTVEPDVAQVHELEQSVVGRVVLTNDSVSAYWNLKVGAEGLQQRFLQDAYYQDDTKLPTRAFDEQRAAGFAEANISFTNQLVARVGGRTEYSRVLGRWNAAPRVALAYQTDEYSQLSAAWGDFYQTPANDLLLSAHRNPDLRFERAAHYLLTYQRIHDDRTLRAEAYYKNYAHLLRYDAARLYQPTAYQSTGTGYARGLDLFWRDRKTVKNLDYWVSYGLLDTRRQQRADAGVAMPTFASRHNLSVVSKYWVQKMHTLFGATYSYGSPRASYDPSFQQFHTPSYHDLSVNLSYVTTLWNNLTIVHVSCSNVLGRQNVFGYRYGATPTADLNYARVAITPSAPRMVFVVLMISINKKRPADTNTAPE
ncbi:TonB-dependent receptor [Hymenobacter sp. BT491]|uniref:TonB-dependent receptor n=1 Tax=Hymenobacter sp. BT491 TaxID=2766779 RepID=UPI001653D92F|nr:TonB-dependent receptor [Hymenobacter sp. BT491]MBC6989260.1 TonB-dependent receptor [Hymenobacter sp. BT491]